MHEAKRRARAAWAYSGKQQDELAKLASINPATMRGYLGRSPRNIPDDDALRAIADAAGVPRRFMVDGFAPDTSVDQLQEQITELRSALAEQAAELARHGREIGALRRAGHRGEPRGDTDRG